MSPTITEKNSARTIPSFVSPIPKNSNIPLAPEITSSIFNGSSHSKDLKEKDIKPISSPNIMTAAEFQDILETFLLTPTWAGKWMKQV